MTTLISSRARKGQTETELARLKAECATWSGRPEAGLYSTQLNALRSLLVGGVEGLERALADVDVTLAEAEVYEDCRLFDLRILWLRRVWKFFKDKLDQRMDGASEAVLRAADDVVWSCFHQVFLLAENLGVDVDHPPPPLPFVEDHYSPEAVPAELVPPGLKTEVDADFRSRCIRPRQRPGGARALASARRI